MDFILSHFILFSLLSTNKTDPIIFMLELHQRTIPPPPADPLHPQTHGSALLFCLSVCLSLYTHTHTHTTTFVQKHHNSTHTLLSLFFVASLLNAIFKKPPSSAAPSACSFHWIRETKARPLTIKRGISPLQAIGVLPLSPTMTGKYRSIDKLEGDKIFSG